MNHQYAQETRHGPRQAYSFADSLIGNFLATAPDGHVVSTDIGGSLFDSIARRRASETGLRFSPFPSLRRYGSVLRRDPPASRAVDVLAEPVVLGQCDGSLRVVNEADMIETYGVHQLDISTRSIDSWCNGQSPLRLLHLGDSGLAQDQLAGAEESLDHDKPVITAYTSGLDRQMFLSFLHARGYGVADLSGGVVEDGRTDSAAGFGWIALPQEHFDVSLSAARRCAEQTMFSEWSQVMSHNAVQRQWQSHSVFGLPPGSPELLQTISADELLADGNCYGVETDGRAIWRWLGPRSRTRMFLPCPLPGNFHIQIVVMSPRLTAASGDYRVLVEGREVRTEIVGNAINVVGQLDHETYAGYLTLEIVSLAPPASNGADRRTLRLSVQSITVSPWH